MPEPVPQPEREDPERRQPPVIDIDQLFGAAREIILEMDGVRYRLRITRRNRLILQK